MGILDLTQKQKIIDLTQQLGSREDLIIEWDTIAYGLSMNQFRTVDLRGGLELTKSSI